VVERHNRPLTTLFWEEESFAEGAIIKVSGAAAHHARVRRVAREDRVRLVDGVGHVAHGKVTEMGKEAIGVQIETVTQEPRPQTLEVIVPVADRDRMLVAAEKCVELQVTAWRPAYFARSRSVTPRGEGPKFLEKVRARMQSALEQSGGAWLPAIQDETEIIPLLAGVSSDWNRLLLDAHGQPLAALASSVPTAIVVGPEGGMEPEEFDAAARGGWRLASLATTTLRFETAIIAAAAVIRATQLTHRSS
jgi:16S rRNA (uracil1498-N3)-methyltransferase